MLRDLHEHTTEESLQAALAPYGALKEVQLLRDSITQASKCVCFLLCCSRRAGSDFVLVCRCCAFVDYVDPSSASTVLNEAREAGGMWIDGVQAQVNNARDREAMAPKSSSGGAMSSAAAQALAAASWGLGQAAPPKPAARAAPAAGGAAAGDGHSGAPVQDEFAQW